LGRGQSFPSDEGKQLEEIIGRRLLCWTPSLLPMVDRIALAGSHDVTVLLTGETGTGKTFLARLVHESSPRKEHRFLVVPCGALAANLVESEFFEIGRASCRERGEVAVGVGSLTKERGRMV